MLPFVTVAVFDEAMARLAGDMRAEWKERGTPIGYRDGLIAATAKARRAWKIFKLNPFDPRLRPHKIHPLSALYDRTIFAVEIEGDQRAVCYVEGDIVVTVDIGTHEIYRG